MKTYQEMSKEELTQELTALKAEYEKNKRHGSCTGYVQRKAGSRPA